MFDGIYCCIRDITGTVLTLTLGAPVGILPRMLSNLGHVPRRGQHRILGGSLEIMSKIYEFW